MKERTMWIAIGLVGLVAAAALGYATNELTQPKIGLVSEPVSAGEALAPKGSTTSAAQVAARERRAARARARAQARAKARTATNPPPPPPAAVAPPAAGADDGGSDDNSGSDGSGKGRGRGRGGDD